MKVVKSIFCIAVLMLASVAANAQKNFVEEADVAYESNELNKAKDLYKKAYSAKPTSPADKVRCLYQIGECYRGLNDPKQAEAWYFKAEKAKYPNPLLLLHLADMLRVNEKCEEAIGKYKLYQQKAPDDIRGKRGTESCEMVEKWKKEPTRHIIENEAQLNTSSFDFSPAIGQKKEHLYFTSTRPGVVGGEDLTSGQFPSDIFFAERDPKGKWSEPKSVEGFVSTAGNEGQPTFDNKGNMIFTRCEFDEDDKEKKKFVCKLMYAKRSGKGFSEPEVLPFGNDTVIVAHPAVSPDGKYLVFASSMKGGLGHEDLWLSTWDGGKWGAAVNLGADINTPGNESFPYIRDDGRLYFSSDYHAGAGGLDIFVSEKAGDGKWNKVKNLQFPLNSIGDDFGIVFENGTNEKNERGYLTSNRNGGKGLDDIYSFTMPPCIIKIQGGSDDKVGVYHNSDELQIKGPDGVVRPTKSGDAVPLVLITITGSDGSVNFTKTADNGSFEFFLKEGVVYKIATCHPEYYKYEQDGISTKGVECGTLIPIQIPLQPLRKAIVLPGIEYDLAKWFLRPEAKLVIDKFFDDVLRKNPTLVIELSAHTDYRSSDVYNQELSEKRAKSVVDYLLEKGIEPGRLVFKGYGEYNPRVVPAMPDANNPKTARSYDDWKKQWGNCGYKAGDVLTEVFIDQTWPKKKGDVCWEDAMQKNRRTEFKVLSSDFTPTNLKLYEGFLSKGCSEPEVK